MSLREVLPEHKCGLYLSHNPHKGDYLTLEGWLENDDLYTWEDDSSKERAIQTGELWTLQWYPDTPIGFFAIAAPTLEELLAYAAKVEEE